jgi:hypothetical protein
VTISDDLVVAGYRAIDYFYDASLYILDTPGHAIGPLSALARIMADIFVFPEGGICHSGIQSNRIRPHAKHSSAERDWASTRIAGLFTIHSLPSAPKEFSDLALL